ncbi:MAG: enoyl-CoA hydratase/isomerase family protein [Carbonactinosporaceae bacterium]
MTQRDTGHATPREGMLLRRHDHVAEIVLNRPEAMNAVSTHSARTTMEVGAAIAADREVRAVVLSAAGGRAFCVGADLKERATLTDAQLLAQRPLFRAAFASILDLPVPTVAAVTGYALGGGFELALGCDLIVADDTAVFGLPEVSVGVIPGGGGTQLLARRVGWSRARDLVFTARRIDADEADRHGIVDRRIAGQGTARAAALELASGIARNSPVALRNAKRALRVGADLPLDAALEVEDAAWRATAFSGDRAEGVRAFVDKRAPHWPGE